MIEGSASKVEWLWSREVLRALGALTYRLSRTRVPVSSLQISTGQPEMSLLSRFNMAVVRPFSSWLIRQPERERSGWWPRLLRDLVPCISE